MSADVRFSANSGPIDWPLPALCRVLLIGRTHSQGARAAAHEHWLYALCVITWRLNGRDRLKHIGRRRLIARVRFGDVSGPPA